MKHFTCSWLLPMLCVLSWAPPIALAQRPVVDTALSRRFEPNARIQWARYYRGRFDDMVEVLLAMASDGTHCRGQLTYLQSQETLLLEGTCEGALFVLTESDAKGIVSGQLTGTLQGETLQAEWLNAANTIGTTLYAREVKAPNTTPKPCSDNKWTARYVARWNEARLDMVLSRQSNRQLSGYLWVEAEGKTYILRGKMLAEERYEVQALLPDGKTAAHLQGNLQTPQGHECLWVGSGEKRTFKLTLRARIISGCMEYADYTSSYDILYPRPECSPCNQTLDQVAAQWVEQIKGAVAAQKRPPIPQNRNALRASAWYTVTCWTENVFCGQLTLSESWRQPPTARPFNFDLRTGKEIALEDLFTRNFNAREWLAEYARKEAPKMPKYASDPPFREWLAREGFPHTTIRRDGLQISTPFHPIYGQHSLVVPYALLKPYMRRDNPIADLVK